MNAFWLALVLSSCAPKGGGSGIDPTPSWSTDTGRVQAKIELAEALVLNGTPEAALQMISQMVEQGARHPDLLVLQGRALTDMGLTDEAEAALNLATRRTPSNAEAHNRLGILYLDQSRTDEAIKRFKAATRSAPKDAEVHNNLGFALMAAGRHTEAIEVLRKALMLDGSQDRTRNNLGLALAATGDDTAAWRVLKAGTDAVSAHTNLALAQEVRGDINAALNTYKAILSLEPDHTKAQAAIARLHALQSKPSQTGSSQ